MTSSVTDSDFIREFLAVQRDGAAAVSALYEEQALAEYVRRLRYSRWHRFLLWAGFRTEAKRYTIDELLSRRYVVTPDGILPVPSTQSPE